MTVVGNYSDQVCDQICGGWAMEGENVVANDWRCGAS
jgi:hypothetical protein